MNIKRGGARHYMAENTTMGTILNIPLFPFGAFYIPSDHYHHWLWLLALCYRCMSDGDGLLLPGGVAVGVAGADCAIDDAFSLL